MTDTEVQVEVHLASNSPSGRHAFGGLQEEMSGEESDCMESLQYTTGQGEAFIHSQWSEVVEPLSLLANVALAPPCGDEVGCGCEREACSCVEARLVEGNLQSLQLLLQMLMSKADHLQECLTNGQGQPEREALTAAVLSFLYTCLPYFNHVESARSTLSQLTPLPFDIYTRLLDVSQQLCDRLEQLVLTYASHNLFCLDETEPNSVSHFCIGESQLGCLQISAFLYCRPMPYLARFDTGLYKCMRWNVDTIRDKRQQTDEEQGGGSEETEAETDTEYYFLCFEDIPNAHAEADSRGVSHGNVMRMWSIGQWVQVDPDPDTEDIYDWIMCEVPQASYHRLLLLGSDEPLSCSVTDILQQLLLSR